MGTIYFDLTISPIFLNWLLEFPLMVHMDAILKDICQNPKILNNFWLLSNFWIEGTVTLELVCLWVVQWEQAEPEKNTQ